MIIARYYAQSIVTGAEFNSNRTSSWQVFDRDWTSERGECLPIAMCIGRAVAFKIRDALNSYENKGKAP